MTTLKTLDETLAVTFAAPTGSAARRPRTSPATRDAWATPSMWSTRRWCDVSQTAYVLDTNTIHKATVAFAGHGSRRLEEHST